LPKEQKIALALGGGGARGLAHIGVLRVLERNKVPISLITGTSIGAIIGAMYAQYPRADRVEEKVRGLFKDPIYKSSGLEYLHNHRMAESWFGHIADYLRERLVITMAAHRRSVIGMERLRNAIAFLIKDDLIKNTKIPFAAIASDLKNGSEVILSAGSIREAVAASAALPGFLPPMELNTRMLVDGAATSPIPIRAAKNLGADKVIAVDVSTDLNPNPQLDNIIDFVLRSYAITARCYHDELIREADVLIRPKVGLTHWSEFEEIDWLVEEGERVAEKNLDKIHDLMDRNILDVIFKKD